jgi:hypothetical protein
MTKLKLGPLPDDKPVKVTLELPAPLHRDLTAYAKILAPSLQLAQTPRRDKRQDTYQSSRAKPGQPIEVPQLERFIATDRGFAKARRLTN